MRSAVVTKVADLIPFFWDHLKIDLRIIGKCLSHGENEVLMVLHRITHHLAGMQPTIGRYMAMNSVVPVKKYVSSTLLCQWVYNEILAGVDGSMVSNANRRVWEDEFQQRALAPNLQVLYAV